MVRRAARRAIAQARSRATRCQTPPPRVLLHGDDCNLLQLKGVEVLSTLDYAVTHVGSADEPWIDAVSCELLYGSGARFFPTVDGVSLADLCRLEVQDHFLEYVRLAGAIRRALTETPASSCKIFTSDPERAQALHSAVRDCVDDYQSWTPPFIRGLRQIGRRVHQQFSKRADGDAQSRISSLLGSAACAPLDASVLFLSEAAPMTQMFGAVEEHLLEADKLRLLRVELGGVTTGASVTRQGNRTVATLPHPSSLPLATVGRFRAQWQSAARRVRTLRIEKPYAGAAGVTSLQAPVASLLEHLYAERFDQLVEHIEFAAGLLDHARPEVLVVGNDRWWVGQAFVRAAQRRGIATLLLQDGLATDKATWWWISAAHVAAFSPALEQLLRTHGVARDRLTVTGQPRYDALCKRRRTRDTCSVQAARTKLDVGATGACVLLATQPHQRAERVAMAVESILESADAHVLLRPHPSERPEKYRACIAANPARVSLCASNDIELLLDAANIVVTEYSTVALEGAILGVPVLIAPFLGDRSEPRIFEGVSVIVHTPQALRDAVRTFSSGSGEPLTRQSVDLARLHALVGPLDGNAGVRVAGLIKSLRTPGVRLPSTVRGDSMTPGRQAPFPRQEIA
jgi:CDP-Glycerol:Poly(glycerophosphate) glycerophosphotransferase